MEDDVDSRERAYLLELGDGTQKLIHASNVGVSDHMVLFLRTTPFGTLISHMYQVSIVASVELVDTEKELTEL